MYVASLYLRSYRFRVALCYESLASRFRGAITLQKVLTGKVWSYELLVTNTFISTMKVVRNARL